MSTLTITAPSGATLVLDLGVLLGEAQPTQAKPAPSAPPAKPEQPKPQQAVTQAPKAPKPAKTAKPSKEAKAARKAANLALMDQIRSLTTQGRFAEAISLAEARGWETVVASVRKAQTAAHTIATPPVQPSAEADAEAMAAALLAPQAPAKPEKAHKGRPASERCTVHNTFLRKDGTCSKCEAGVPAKGASKGAAAAILAEIGVTSPVIPAEPVHVPTPEEALATQEEAMFPSGLSEAALAEHWAMVAAKPYGRNMLQAARKRCLAVVADTKRSTEERTIWAQRSQTLKGLLAKVA